MGKLEPGSELTVADLKEQHELYEYNYDEWLFLMASYEGTKELVEKGYMKQNERESNSNWERRKAEATGFDYSKSIVDLFNYYLFKKPVKRDLGKLKTDTQWQSFYTDCNLYGDGFDDFLTEQGRYSSIEGHVGIMVDKPNKDYGSIQEEIDANIYPYLAAYFPTAILDWEYERDENNRPHLEYMKLIDDDGKYRLWWRGIWEMWELPTEEVSTDVSVSGQLTQETKAIKVDEGMYDLKEIPFVWLINIKSKDRPIGMSDIHEVARLDVSILNNVSQGEEIINYAAFPMMRKPYKESKPGLISAPGNDDVSVQVILEFDPENPDSKPDWLEARVIEPIDALLNWISRKVQEIYRVVNAGGMASTEISTDAKSGLALKTEFQLLNSALVRKAKNLEKAEKQIIEYWLAWQKKEELYAKISVERERTYDVEDLAGDLENILTAGLIVKSRKFNDRMQKNVIRAMLPAAEDDELKEMDDEIDNYEEFSEFNPDEEFISDDEEDIQYDENNIDNTKKK